MSDFRTVTGFDNLWRPPAGGRKVVARAVIQPPAARSSGDGAAAKARLARVVDRAPEVMVKVTGRTKSGAHLMAHLDYISRQGRLDLEQSDGAIIRGAEAVRELGEDWAEAGENDSRRRANTNMSFSVVLSMPPGTNIDAMKDAVRSFARAEFGERHPYAFAVHTDEAHPHAHLSVRALGQQGERLNPRKADLVAWRERFAAELRQRGIVAEATPRRARGIVLKPERTALRKTRERFEATGRNEPRVIREARREAREVTEQALKLQPWERKALQRQQEVRAVYKAAAAVLAKSADPGDRALAQKVETFTKGMPPPVSRRVLMAREIQAERAKAQQREGQGAETPAQAKDRVRKR